MLVNKTLPTLIAILIIVSAWFFFSTNSSYQLSLKAKFYYEIGNYETANKLSKEAYEGDIYNKMALTIFKKSEDALILTRYIKQGEEYLKNIENISNSSVDQAQKQRIKIMCDIMIDEFEDIAKKAKNKDLLDESSKMKDNFKTLKSELFG